METKKETTTMKVTKELRNYLDEKGKRGETFDDIIKRLVKFKGKKSEGADGNT